MVVPQPVRFRWTPCDTRAWLPPAILVVDDDSDITLVLQDLLEHAGYHVHVADTGSEVLAKARGESVSAILLDLMLPDVDGLSVSTLLKKFDPVLPVIMLTACVEMVTAARNDFERSFTSRTGPVRVKGVGCRPTRCLSRYARPRGGRCDVAQDSTERKQQPLRNGRTRCVW